MHSDGPIETSEREATDPGAIKRGPITIGIDVGGDRLTCLLSQTFEVPHQAFESCTAAWALVDASTFVDQLRALGPMHRSVVLRFLSECGTTASIAAELKQQLGAPSTGWVDPAREKAANEAAIQAGVCVELPPIETHRAWTGRLASAWRRLVGR